MNRFTDAVVYCIQAVAGSLAWFVVFAHVFNNGMWAAAVNRSLCVVLVGAAACTGLCSALCRAASIARLAFAFSLVPMLWVVLLGCSENVASYGVSFWVGLALALYASASLGGWLTRSLLCSRAVEKGSTLSSLTSQVSPTDFDEDRTEI